MIKIATIIAIASLVIIGLFIIGCCSSGDNACYKVWWGLEPHPADPNRYTDPWERFLNPAVRQADDPGQGFWDWVFGIKK
ncbi:MAG: hypothetical protein FVQ80_15205 [Planctomycetes bacterium]|nr:hypothetical protein [Planctomycetota bacterium]